MAEKPHCFKSRTYVAAVLDGEDLEAPNPRSHALSVTTSRYEMQKVSSRFIDRCAQSQRSSRRELGGGPLAPRAGSPRRERWAAPPARPRGAHAGPKASRARPERRKCFAQRAGAADEALFTVAGLRRSVETVSRHQRERAGRAGGSGPFIPPAHPASLGSA